ncbi:hypothetical protein ACJIZ3_003481 [Penstemon smallii]|uniref:Uncharacterized protein n=1 Tax=Penstemon smallii TaxID=265156 RepID=A0ABD3UD69_9LAMI
MGGLSSSIFILRRRLMPSPPRMSKFLLTSMVAKKKSNLNPPNNLCNLPNFFGLFANHNFASFSSSTLSNIGNNETMEKIPQVEIISEENIKPSSPTPDHLRTYEVSFLDQLHSNIYMSFVYFYSNNHQTNLKFSRGQLLKQSLSETLKNFYPLAGKVKDSRHIDCNDDGVYYVEAKIKYQLSDFLKQPDNKSIHQFLPVDPKSLDLLSSKTYVTMIQVTEFDCGGIAIGLHTSHKIIDGYSHATFLAAWAAAARGTTSSNSEEEIIPSFISHSIFPSNSELPENTTWLSLLQSLKHSKRVTKRFLFGSSSIINLKKSADAPTRVTAVTGLIWKCVIAASRPKKDISNNCKKLCILFVIVNLRNKSSPPMPNYLIGNIIWNARITIPQSRSEDDDDHNDGLELDVIVRNIKNTIDEINNDFIEQMKEEEWSLKVVEQLNEMKRFPPGEENILHMTVSSLCNSGLHELDFGWGKPIWASVGNADADNPILSGSNLMLLIDTRSGKGIEAWVTLPEEVMTVLEKDPELLAFASVNPSPLETDD